MLNDFRILSENTFNFKGGKLYLMLLRENAKYGVEIVDREKSFGRKFAESRAEADYLFESIVNRLSKYKSLKDAEIAIKRCFSLKSLDKLLFVLIMDDSVVTQDDIKSLKEKLKFKTRVKVNYLKSKKKENALTVYVYLNSEKRAFGVLTGTREAKDLKLELL